MKKSTRIVRKLLALFLVVLMSIESFGALVSDNDGSAFITKGEFDSLRSDFQTQINNYNTSLDNKIDGAIAAYLAGISVKSEPFVMLDRIKSSIGRDLRFNNGYDVGTTLTAQYIVTTEKSYSIKYKNKDDERFKTKTYNEIMSKYGSRYNRNVNWRSNNYSTVGVLWDTSGTQLLAFEVPANQNGAFYFGASAAGSNFNIQYAVTDVSVYPTSSASLTLGQWTCSRSINVDDSSSVKYVHVVIPAGSAEKFAFAVSMKYQNFNSGNVTLSSLGSSWIQPYFNTGGYLDASNERKVHYLFNQNWNRSGSGQCWIKTDLPNGNMQLLGYKTTYPLVILSLSSKWYKDFGTVTLANNVFNNTTAHSHDWYLPSDWGYATGGTHYMVYNETNNNRWYQQVCTQYSENMQNTNVQLDQWGVGTGTNLKYIDLYQKPTWVSDTLASHLSYPQAVHVIEGYNSTLGAINMTVQPSGFGVGLLTGEAPMSNFEHIYLSAVAGETVRLGGGAPLMEMQSSKDTEYDVTLKLRLYNASNDALTQGQAYVMLSKNQFNNGVFVAIDDILFDDTVTFDSTGQAELVISGLTGVDKGKKVWYNLAPYTAGHYAVCTECEVKVK